MKEKKIHDGKTGFYFKEVQNDAEMGLDIDVRIHISEYDDICVACEELKRLKDEKSPITAAWD